MVVVAVDHVVVPPQQLSVPCEDPLGLFDEPLVISVPPDDIPPIDP